MSQDEDESGDSTGIEGDEYRCEACGKTFETEAALEEHVDSVGLCY